MTAPARKRTKTRIGLVIACVLAVAGGGMLQAGEGGVSAQAVDATIRKGQEYLIAVQRLDGSWSKDGTDVTGFTALCALALVKSGIPADHPAVQKALNYLAVRPAARTYDVAMIAVLLRTLDAGAHQAWIARCAGHLIDSQVTGMWAYPSPPCDMSNSQYAALGLGAAAEAGVKVPVRVWEDLLARVVALQCDDGGFGYRPGSQPTGSMTCAAVTCLVIARAELEKLGKGVSAAARSQGALARGLAWLDLHFRADANPTPHEQDPPHRFRWHYYYLYGIERTGALCGRSEFGGKDWYREGAAWLVANQGSHGSFGTAYGEPEMNTPFALLFLSRATTGSYTGRETAGIFSDGKERDIVIGCDRKNPGHVWIESWSENVLEIFGVDGGRKGIRVKKIEYFAGGELLAEVTEDPTGGRIARFPYEYRFEQNGEKELFARATCAMPDDLILKTFESAPVKFTVNNNLTDRDREAMEDVRANLAAGARPEIEASSAWDGGWREGCAADGLQGTSWLSAKPEDDGAPWIAMRFEKPLRANLLKVTQALGDVFAPGKYGRATRVRVLINRGSQKVIADLRGEEGVKDSIRFKTTNVRDLKIEIIDRAAGSELAAAGFAEIELFLEGNDG